jgi:hypothetical protein
MINGEFIQTNDAIASRTRLRSADGRLHTRQKRLDRILEYLIARTKIDEKGALQFRDFTDLRWRPLLASSFSISLNDESELNPWDTAELVWNAFVELRKQSMPFSVANWVEQCDRHINGILGQGEQLFRVYTTASLADEAGEWLIGLPYEHAVLPSGASEFPTPPCLEEPYSHAQLAHMRAMKGIAIEIRVPAVTAHEAVHRAIRVLSVWRGLMSLYADRKAWAMTFSGEERRPLAVVQAGSLLVASDGAGRVIDQYWHETSTGEPRDLFTPKKDDSHRLALMTHAGSQIPHLPYHADLEKVLVRYADALTYTDYSMTVVHLWGVLEELVGGANGDHTNVARRAVALDAPRREQDFAKDVLDLARISRNLLVHAGTRPYSEEQMAYLLKPVVDRHLRFLIRNPRQYTRMEDHRQAMARSSGTVTQKHRPECDCTTTSTP